MKIYPRLVLTALLLMPALLVAACVQGNVATNDPGTPGGTGRTVIIGNNSTIAGDATATENQQKWPIGRGR